MATEKNYESEARSDAWETMREFVDEMVTQFRDNGTVSNDLNNDYGNGDAYHHESHVDRDYRLTEASAILDQLHRYEETDSGLWEGSEPRRAIATQAAYTYGNAVYSMWSDLVDDLNGYLDALRDTMTEAETGLEDSTDEVNAAAERLIRTFVLFGDDDGGRYEGLLSATWGDVQCGGTTALMVLADKADEGGRESFAKSCRTIAAVVVAE